MNRWQYEAKIFGSLMGNRGQTEGFQIIETKNSENVPSVPEFPVLLLLTGAWYIYGGIASLFPTRHGGIASLYHTRYFRGAYPESGLAGKNYHAELDENGFSVRGDSCSWRVLWTEVLRKGENGCVFMFNAKGTLFIFGKQYLTDAQQKDIRQFAAMP